MTSNTINFIPILSVCLRRKPGNLRVLLHTKAPSRLLFQENIAFFEDSSENVLIIHEKTHKEIMSVKESVYVIKISADLYKL